MNNAIDGCQRHGGVWEDSIPVAKRLVGGNQERSPLVAGTDELEENGGFRLILADVRKIVEHQ